VFLDALRAYLHAFSLLLLLIKDRKSRKNHSKKRGLGRAFACKESFQIEFSSRASVIRPHGKQAGDAFERPTFPSPTPSLLDEPDEPNPSDDGLG
jgi:hypothetical protein